MDIVKVLNRLEIGKTGHYDDEFYVIDFEDSDEAARIYTLLDKNAVNTDYPNFEVNTNNTVMKVVNYFELELDGKTYVLFLFSNYDENKYYLKIGVKK